MYSWQLLSPGYPLNSEAVPRGRLRAGCWAGGWRAVCTAKKNVNERANMRKFCSRPTCRQSWNERTGRTAAFAVGEELVQLLLDLGQLFFCEPTPGLCCLWWLLLLLLPLGDFPPPWWGRDPARGWDGSCDHTFWEVQSDYLETWEKLVNCLFTWSHKEYEATNFPKAETCLQ